jgi:hypothetical protein
MTANKLIEDRRLWFAVHVTRGQWTEPNTQTFHLHQNFICHYSPFFDAAFNGKYIDGQTKELDFDETDW